MFAYGYGYAHAFAYDYAIVPAPVFAVSYVNVIQSIHWQPAALTLHAHWGGARYWSGWYGFRDEWATSLQWMRREEYEAWHEWQRSIRSRNLSTVESAQLLYRILQAQDETVPSERERIVERMMQSTMEISRDEFGHVEGIVEEVDDDHRTSSSNRRLAIEAPEYDRDSPRTSMTQRRAAMAAQEEDSYSVTRSSSSRSKSKHSKANEEYYEPEQPPPSRKRDKKGRKEKNMDAIYEDEVYDGGEYGYGDNGHGEDVYEETKVSKRSSKKSSHKPEASSSRSLMEVSNDLGVGSSSRKSKKSSSTVTTTTTTTTTTSTSEQYDEGSSHKSSSKKGKSKLMIEGKSSKKGKEALMIKSSRDCPASPMAAGLGGRWADSGPPDGDLADDFDDMTLYPDDSVSNVEGKKKKKDKKKLFSRA